MASSAQSSSKIKLDTGTLYSTQEALSPDPPNIPREHKPLAPRISHCGDDGGCGGDGNVGGNGEGDGNGAAGRAGSGAATVTTATTATTTVATTTPKMGYARVPEGNVPRVHSELSNTGILNIGHTGLSYIRNTGVSNFGNAGFVQYWEIVITQY